MYTAEIPYSDMDPTDTLIFWFLNISIALTKHYPIKYTVKNTFLSY